MVDDDVVLVGAADDHLRPREIELLAGEVRRDDDQLAVADRRGERGDLGGGRDRAAGGIGVGDRGRRAVRCGRPGSRGACAPIGAVGRTPAIAGITSVGRRAVDALDRHRARVVDLLDAFGLEVELVVADLDLVADAQRDALGDPRVVDADAVVAAEVLDLDLAVVAQDPGVAARHVPLGEPDRVAFFATDRDLVTDQRDDCRLPFVILDHQLEHRAMCPRDKR